jgi:hypothetical protein
MTKKSKRKCVVIAGMHRSGTSALSRVMTLLGCTAAQNIIPADEHNQTGYWEPEAINNFNDGVIESLGSTWFDWAAQTSDWIDSPALEDFEARALALYDAEYGNANLTVLKDPRICKLLPFWLPVLENAGIEPYILLPIRNPKEVAASMAKRDGSDLYYNHLVWLRHVLEAEAGSRGRKRAFVTYDDLIENYATVMSTSAERLGLKWPRQSAQANEEIEAYINDQYRHQKFSGKSLSTDISLSDWLRDTYEIMLRWAATGEDKNDHKKLDVIFDEFNAAARRFNRVIYRGNVAMMRVSGFEQVEREKNDQIAALNNQISANASEHASQCELLSARATGLEKGMLGVRTELMQAQQQTLAVQRALSEVEGHLAHQQSETANSLAALEELHKSQMRERNNTIAALQAALSAAQNSAQVSTSLFDAEKTVFDAEKMAFDAEKTMLVAREADLRAELEIAVSALAEADATYTASLTEAEATHTARLAEIEAIKANFAVVETEYGKKLAEIEQSKAILTKGFRETFDLAEQDNEELTKKLKDAQAALDALEQARRTQLYELNQVRSTLAQKKAEADDYHFELQRYQAERGELVGAIETLQHEITATRSQGGKLAAQIQGIVRAMDDEITMPLVPKRFKRSKNKKLLAAAGLVDREWYLANYPDVSAMGFDPTLHYASHGASEGRSPNAEHASLKAN